MEIENREYIISLYDLYYKLLTDKQSNYFEEYFLYDLSLAEIASNHDVSRNAVYDQLKKVISILENYEEKICLRQKEIKIQGLAKKISDVNIKNELINVMKE